MQASGLFQSLGLRELPPSCAAGTVRTAYRSESFTYACFSTTLL